MTNDPNQQSLQAAQANAEQLGQSLNGLNKTLDDLGKSQTALSSSFQQSSKTFKDSADTIQDTGNAIKAFNDQIAKNAEMLKAATESVQTHKVTLTTLNAQYTSLTKTQNDNSTTTQSLSLQISQFSATIVDQEKKLAKSKETFDFHAKAVEALKSSFDKIKGAAGDFAPALEDVSKGFNAMKDGLSVVKTGFQGVGSAIAATGFGLLVIILQSVTEWLTKSEKGQRVLTAALKDISKVVEVVKGVFMDLGGAIAKAIIHPVDTIKSVWADVIKTITDQLKPFKTILEGILHLNFNEIKDGFTEIGKRISNTANTIVSNVKKAKDGIVGFATDIKKAFDTPDTGGSTNTNKPQKHKTQLQSPGSKTTSSSSASGREDLPQATSAGVNTGDDDQSAKQLQQQLDTENKMVITAAKFRETEAARIKKEGNEKQAQLDKERLTAFTSITSAVISIFGKNTVAAKAAFKAHQAVAAAEVIISTRQSVMNIWEADSGIPIIGVPKAIAETAIVVAAGASNLAAILKQKPGFAQGGQFVSDGRGALLSGYSRTDNTNAYLRSGEAVVVSEAMRNPWARNLVSAINVAHGGRDFSLPNPGKGYAIGGIFTDGGNANRYYSQPMNDVKDLANTMAYQMINNFPPIYVDVKDVNNQQNILAQTVNRVNL
jgi:predicted  nucleic acid-binding Zn-ribbon protein